MKIMKILFFLRWAGVRYGGGETHVIELASRMANRGHEVHVLTRDGKRVNEFGSKIKVWCVSKNWKESDHSYVASDIRLYLHTTFFLIKSFLMMLSLKKRGINYDIISVHHVTESFLMRLIRKFFRWSYIFFLDGYTDLEAREAKYADLQLAISQTIINKCNANYGYKPLLGLVGTDVTQFTAKGQRLSFESGQKVVFTVSRLATQKNLHIYIEAAKLVCKKDPNFLFLIGGEGPDKNRLIRLIAEYNLQNKVILVGGISQEKLPVYYRSADMFVTTEFPPDETLITVIEALSSGVPVIGTSPTGRFEVIGESGAIVPFDRPDLLANKILEVSNNPKLRRKMITQGLERAKLYDWNRLIKIYEKACNKVIKSKS